MRGACGKVLTGTDQGDAPELPAFRIFQPFLMGTGRARRELEDIFRFRYAHHFHRFPEGYPGLDHARSRLTEPHDRSSTHYLALDDQGRMCAVSTATAASENSLPPAWREWLKLDRLAPLGPDRVVISSHLVVRPDRRGTGLFGRFHRFIMAAYLDSGYRYAVHYCSPGLICHYERLGHRAYAEPFVMPMGSAEYGSLLRTPMLMDLGDAPHLLRVGSPITDLCAANPPYGGPENLAALLPELRGRPNFRLMTPSERSAYVRAYLGPSATPLPSREDMPALEHASPLAVLAGQAHTPSPDGGLFCLVLAGTFQEGGDFQTTGTGRTSGAGTFLGISLLTDPAALPLPFTALTAAEILVFDPRLTRDAASSLGSDTGPSAVWRALDAAARRRTGLDAAHPRPSGPARAATSAGHAEKNGHGDQSMWEAIVDRQTGYACFTPELADAMRRCRVAIVGTGGNGAVMDQLLRVGFERFILVDPDTVETTNLNRLPFSAAAIGLPKVEAWKRCLVAVNPDCRVTSHQRAITRHDGAWLTDILGQADLVFLGTTDLEANLVTGRVCARLGRRMIVGPASSGAYVVSTFTHDNSVTFESVAGFGTEGTDLEDIDYPSLRPAFQALSFYPGRGRKLRPGVRRDMLEGRLPARSCRIFVSLTNSAMAFEAVKNVAVMHGLPLEGTRIVAMPVFHIFDPYSGCAYYYHILNREIGIPDWLTGKVRWQPYVEGRWSPGADADDQ